MKQFDYLIVGAGLFGSVFANEATKRGKKCLVIDKRGHIGGNVYTERIEGITVHKYGAHIFHTNDKPIWDYVNSIVPFNHYRHTVLANYANELYNLPFNMNTFSRLWGVITPEEAQEKILRQIEASGVKKITNLEEQALSLVGTDIYYKLIKGYTEKQWGRPANTLPSFIIKRLPVRFTFSNDYFTDRYQGIPTGGYTTIIEKMLERCDIRLGIDFFKSKNELVDIAHQVVFTGMIDQYFDYRFGILEYRSLRFENNLLPITNYQGSAVVNYTHPDVPYTRIIEHKHFEFGEQPMTYITREYSQEWSPGQEPYYPVNDEKNDTVFRKYRQLAEQEKNVIFGGRLAEYRYYDMHQVIGSALKTVSEIFGK